MVLDKDILADMDAFRGESACARARKTRAMRSADLLLAAFYAFALWGNIAVDVWMGLDVDLRTTGFAFHRLVWQSGHDFDPLFLNNGPYMRWSALGTALLYAPYYGAMPPCGL